MSEDKELGLSKNFEASKVEDKIYQKWESSGAFKTDVNSSKPKYTIMMPPPNVTGSLHMGHALTFTLQDLLIRYHRMRGFEVLWQAGTDHAGIATQMVVERQLAAQNITRYDLGREEFIKRIWQWKEESGGTITKQLRRLGASCDWDRERFTLDEGLSEGVRKVFVALYKKGLIYRDKRLVNWDSKLQTAISDLEVEQKETQGSMWYLRYPFVDNQSKYIVIATTRPETIFADGAIAVHPDDERYKDMIGKKVYIPILNKEIPIIADEYPDPTKGTGAVKITPAHDFNDFEVGKRHDIEQLNIFTPEITLNDNVPAEFVGLARDIARKEVVAKVEELGLLDKIEPHNLTIPYGDRSGEVIEPYLLDQWFVDAPSMGKVALEAVKNDYTKFVPKQWENTYFDWMNKLQPWCISRQIWWGHQVPVWYGQDGHFFVEESFAEARDAAVKYYGSNDIELTQDTDVLDTWFSSALWPFTTLGWPQDDSLLKDFYPTSVLVTGFDIIFFWVARMMMMGLEFIKEVPFKEVYIHALVRDQKGHKMSKSKGNVIDPLEIMDKYGADALRFTLASLAAQGRDIRIGDSVIEGYRNFITKLWNAARFNEMNQCFSNPDFDYRMVKLPINRWIISQLAEAINETSKSLDSYRFNEASATIYHFVWGNYCDWYLELMKPIMQSGNELEIAETRETSAFVFDTILGLMHPFTPYVTEELWTARKGDACEFLINSKWPELSGFDFKDDAGSINWLIKGIGRIRAIRSEVNIPASKFVTLEVKTDTKEQQNIFVTQSSLWKRLARLEDIKFISEVSSGSIVDVIDDVLVAIPLEGVVDIEKEKLRLQKSLQKVETELQNLKQRLDNEDFVKKAPTSVIEMQRSQCDELLVTRDKLAQILSRLNS